MAQKSTRRGLKNIYVDYLGNLIIDGKIKEDITDLTNDLTYKSKFGSPGGKNLLDTLFLISNAKNSVKGVTPFKFENGKTYTMSCISKVSYSNYWLYVIEKGTNSNISTSYLILDKLGYKSTTFTIPTDGKDYYLSVAASGIPNYYQYISMFNGTFCDNLQIEEGSSATEYEPYIKSLKDLTDSALNVDLLWTNANTESEFATQRIELDLINYKSFIIVYLNSVNNLSSATAQYYPSIGNYTFSWMYYANTTNLFRSITIANDGITFGNCTVNATDTSNVDMIPYKIYGVR